MVYLRMKKYGHYVDERCPCCGKFVEREDAFFDRKDRNNECSEVLRFCDLECADEWHRDRELHQVESFMP